MCSAQVGTPAPWEGTVPRVRWVKTGLVLALLFVVTGCTSPIYDSRGVNGAATSGSAVGVTPHTVTISLIVADLSLLTKQHLAPDIGDPVKVAQAVVHQINASGGVAGGRRLVLVPHVINLQGANESTLNQVCIEATEQDQPLAVVVAAAVPVNVVQCVAVSHQQLAITMNSWQRQVYLDADGRVFSVADSLSANIERTWGALPPILERVHALENKRVGIISVDEPTDRAAAASAVASALHRAHIPVAAQVTLPFPAGGLNCAQTDVAIQRMRQAHVNFIFLVPQELCGAAVVEAAAAVGYKPTWATAGDNTTNTVAQFYAPAKNEFDGAWGLSGVFAAPSAAALRCNALVTRATGVHYLPSSDAFGFTASTCLQIETLATALDDASGTLTQGAVVRALTAMHSVTMSSGPDGSLSPTKHDAGDWAILARYNAASGKFEPYDPTPLRIP
jgi:ABC-type branched-subunit amino acid transport system substrate-binding protein